MDLHRKWIAALLGAVQVGGGSSGKDLVICQPDYDINLSTRFASQFGEINIGKWVLLETDVAKFLQPNEIENLSSGSPEERQVLRRKLIIYALAESYRKRAFLIHVCQPDGTIFCIGWDMGNSLLEAYKEGKVVVRGQENESKEILIADDGHIVSAVDYSVMFVKDTGEIDGSGRPLTAEVPFLQRREGSLYFVASLDTIKLASAGLSGSFFASAPYGGNPSDIPKLKASIPGLSEILNRQIA